MKKCLLLPAKLCRVPCNAWAREVVNKGSVHCCWGWALWNRAMRINGQTHGERLEGRARQWDAVCKPGKGSILLRQILVHNHGEKLKYIIYHFLLEKGAPGFLPCSTLTLFEVPCHNQRPCSHEPDRYDSFQHLSMQLLNPHLTSGINMHWYLGQIHITHYFIKNRTDFCVKRALVKRGNRNHPAKSLK